MLSSLFTIAKKSVPACWRESQSAPAFVLKISKVDATMYVTLSEMQRPGLTTA